MCSQSYSVIHTLGKCRSEEVLGIGDRLLVHFEAVGTCLSKPAVFSEFQHESACYQGSSIKLGVTWLHMPVLHWLNPRKQTDAQLGLGRAMLSSLMDSFFVGRLRDVRRPGPDLQMDALGLHSS